MPLSGEHCVKSYCNECYLENLCAVELQLTIQFVIESEFLHFYYFLTTILILAILEGNTVHSPLFNIYCTCIVRSTNEFQISLNICMYHKVANNRLSRLVAHNGSFRFLMKGIFDAYVL